MDALLQHENHAQEQIQAAIQGSLSTLCTRELVPGVKRVLAAQALLNRALRVQSARSLARAAFVVLLHSVLC